VYRIIQDKDKNIIDPDIVSWVNRKFVKTFEDDFKNCFDLLAKNNKDMVDKIGFINWFERKIISLSIKNPQKTIFEIKKLFMKYDKDKSNNMNKEEFRVFFWWIQA